MKELILTVYEYPWTSLYTALLIALSLSPIKITFFDKDK